MNRPLLWIAAAGATVAAGALLLTRKPSAPPASPPTPSPPQVGPPPKTYGEATRVALAVPSGWRRVTGAEVSALPELGARANALRNTPGFTSMTYGTLDSFVASNGGTYATWIEQHYHPPGGAAQPWGYHHGVTILASSALV